jgi:uncharacterized protein (DUF1501 family)
MIQISLDRRRLLAGAGALAVATSCGQLALAAAAGERKFVLVILRGAMDGLSAVSPYEDPNYHAARSKLALAPPGEPGGVLKTADGFGLHPKLVFMKDRWDAGQLAILHAAASPYRDRSHFDGQDVLETGAARVFGASDGWLNRAVACLPAGGRSTAVGIGGSVPLVLRGKAQVSSWAPSVAPAPLSDTVNRLTELYGGDPLLSPILAQAVQTDALVATGDSAAMGGGGAGRAAGMGAYKVLASAAASLLTAPGGPAGAVISLDGWDTHAGQGAEAGILAIRLQGLDATLQTLKEDLGDQWSNTVVVVATEFGRTVAMNGTGGTDHGTGSVAFALGGAVKGGRMLGNWPTLAPAALLDNRDLAPANDVRSLFAAVLRDHWGLARSDLTGKVFADSPQLRAIDGLVA